MNWLDILAPLAVLAFGAFASLDIKGPVSPNGKQAGLRKP
jgi:hypothetical protein